MTYAVALDDHRVSSISGEAYHSSYASRLGRQPRQPVGHAGSLR